MLSDLFLNFVSKNPDFSLGLVASINEDLAPKDFSIRELEEIKDFFLWINELPPAETHPHLYQDLKTNSLLRLKYFANYYANEQRLNDIRKLEAVNYWLLYYKELFPEGSAEPINLIAFAATCLSDDPIRLCVFVCFLLERGLVLKEVIQSNFLYILASLAGYSTEENSITSSFYRLLTFIENKTCEVRLETQTIACIHELLIYADTTPCRDCSCTNLKFPNQNSSYSSISLSGKTIVHERPFVVNQESSSISIPPFKFKAYQRNT